VKRQPYRRSNWSAEERAGDCWGFAGFGECENTHDRIVFAFRLICRFDDIQRRRQRLAGQTPHRDAIVVDRGNGRVRDGTRKTSARRRRDHRLLEHSNDEEHSCRGEGHRRLQVGCA